MDDVWSPGEPADMDMSTAMTVFIHSYSSDIADVLIFEFVYLFKKYRFNLFIKFVNGSSSFLPSRGSSGTSAPN
jgi:hypothetical protein